MRCVARVYSFRAESHEDFDTNLETAIFQRPDKQVTSAANVRGRSQNDRLTIRGVVHNCLAGTHQRLQVRHQVLVDRGRHADEDMARSRHQIEPRG